MSSVTEGNLGLNYGWAYGESGWNTGMDDNLVKLGFTSRKRVKGILSAPPSAPSNGDAYIVGTSPTGLFSGNFGKVAICDRTVWLFLTPKNHEVVYNVADGCDYKYDNGWVLKQEDELSPYVKVKDFTFSTGYTITDQKQCLLNLADNKYYQWFGTLPKEVPAGSTPSTSGGIGALLWVDRTDLMLRSELAFSTGASLIGGVTQWFDTVADMTAYPIVDGKVYACKRYYAGGSLIPNLVFVGETGATTDTVSVLATAGVPARLMSGEYFEQYGVKLDGTDQSAKLNAIYASGLRANLSFCSFAGTLGIKNSVISPYTVSTDAHRGIDILPIAGGTFINNYMFLLNCSNGTTWDDDFPNAVAPHFSGFYFDNSVSNIVGLKGILFAGTYTIRNLRGRNMAGIVHQTNDYSDHVSVNNIFGTLPQDGWMIDLYGLGDGCVIDQTAVYSGAQSSHPVPGKLIRCRNTIGGQIKNPIVGIIMVENCSAITIDAAHMELGQIIIQNSNAVVRNSAVWVNNGNAPIILNSSLPTSTRYTVILDGFLAMDDNLWSRPTTYCDIDASSGFEVEIRNSYRATRSGATDLTYSQLFGLKVAQRGVEVPNFTRYSWLYSDGCVWDTSTGIVKPYRNKITLGGGSFTGLGSLSPTNTPFGKYAAGTYYFTAKLVLDDVRAIGRNMDASEKTATVTQNQAIYMSLDFGSAHRAGTLYLYRGTSAGVYTHVCRIPISNCNQLTDHGNDVNGYPWETVGSVLSLQAIDSAYEFTSSSTVEVTTGPAFTPTLGTWQIGDRIKYLSATPSAGTVKTSSRRLTTGNAHVYGTDWYYTTEGVSST